MKNVSAVAYKRGVPHLLQEDWRAYAEFCAAKGLSPRTVKTAATDVGKLACFMRGRALSALAELTPPLLQTFQLWLRDARGTSLARPRVRLAPATRAKAVANLRSFLRWAHRTERIPADLTELLLIPRTPKTLPRRVPTLSEITRLLRTQLSPRVPQPLGRHNAALFAFLFATGVRRQGALDLCVDELDLTRREAWVRVKGGRRQLLFFKPWAAELLADYLTRVRPLWAGPQSAGRVFLRPDGRPLFGQYLLRLCAAAARAARWQHHFYPHALRHAFCLHLLQNGASIRAVNALAGHQSLNVTARYTKLNLRELRAVVRRAHPRGAG